ncbi:hypothetical protein [Neptunomonas japonica]|uniref:hypothetical protein n=1 Tax=Neptunomonas japonica TaxID=417574 RepID=UPI000408DCF7|nr:hypothetical protein [Neptunomonas japonica]
MKKYLPVFFILVPAVLLAPASRIYKHQSTVRPAVEQPLSISAISYPDLIDIGSIQAANQGPYKIRGYQHRLCAGSIALLTLYRNAEGSHILKAIINDDEMSYGVIFNGRIYSRFPQWEFTVQRVIDKFQLLLSSSSRESNATPHPQAFAEKGTCNIAASLVADASQNAKTSD